MGLSSRCISRFLTRRLPSLFEPPQSGWTMNLEFSVEFLRMHELERARLEQFLATQVNIAA